MHLFKYGLSLFVSLTLAGSAYGWQNPNPNGECETEPACAECELCYYPVYCVYTESYMTQMEANSLQIGVYTFNGEAVVTGEDLRVPGVTKDMTWSRKYRSDQDFSTAMGNHWDYSYNVYVVDNGDGSFKVHNGWGRDDNYFFNPDFGVYTAQDFHRELTIEDDGSLKLTFPDASSWHFHPLDGKPESGKLYSIFDRNDNTITLAYDARGRLAEVFDNQGRSMSVAYDREGFISSVSDSLGRKVTYDHLKADGENGTAGDLASVTTPAVLGTPNENDFPNGKTTGYTYTNGSQNQDLNGLLESVTSPRGDVLATFVYHRSENPEDPNLGRVVELSNDAEGAVATPIFTHSEPFENKVDKSQPPALPAPKGTTQYHYQPVSPSSANNKAVMRTVINDERGSVREVFHDANQRLVMERRFYGFAVANQVTTTTTNRPRGKSRPSDPDYLETRYSYNSQGMVTRIDHPNGNYETRKYDDSNPVFRARKNLLMHCKNPGPLGGDQAQNCEVFEYANSFAGAGSGCCGGGFADKVIDANSNVVTYKFDQFGNRTMRENAAEGILHEWIYDSMGRLWKHIWPDNGSGCRRVDVYSYYASGPQRGWLESVTVDADDPLACAGPHFNLKTKYEYDVWGNTVKLTDPEGNETLTTYNALGQIVRRQSPEVTTPSGPVRYETLFAYDANNNLVQTDVLNVNDQGVTQANAWFTTTRTFDSSGNMLSITEEVDAAKSVTRSYQYDGADNVVLERFGEATNGNQPQNTVTYRYDAQNRLFEKIRALGHGTQTTSQYTYDGNGNQTEVQTGTEGSPRVTYMEYDGYDRLVVVIDGMGNEVFYNYDGNNNKTRETVMGQLNDDLGNPAANIRLAEASFLYDAEDRRTHEIEYHFDAATQLNIGDGARTTQTTWTPASQEQSIIYDNGGTETSVYDTAHRRLSLTDAMGNQQLFQYDLNGNITQETMVERPDGGGVDERNDSFYQFDGLDRMILLTDHVGNQTASAYDSRNNLTRTTDALGDAVLTSFDGLNREVTRQHQSAGNGPTAAVTYEWDDSSRLIKLTDPNGNITERVYDPVNRISDIQFADCTVYSQVHDHHSNVIQITDANGSVKQYGYDLLNRPISATIQPGSGVSADTTTETYAYDGMSRFTSLEDNDSKVERSYDSLFQTKEETLNGKVIGYVMDANGTPSRISYPGGRVIDLTYDLLNRQKTVSEAGSTLVSVDYVGPGRIEQRTLGGAVQVDYAYNGYHTSTPPAGDAGVRSLVGTQATRLSDGQIIDDRAFTWDGAGYKVRSEDLRAGSLLLAHNYGHDGLKRVDSVTVQSNGSQIFTESFNYDAAGNRTSVTGGFQPGNYTMDASLCEPADRQLNQYTTTPIGSASYDPNGNMTSLGGTMVYDHRNQLTELTDGSGRRHRFFYDVLGRRIKTITDADGAANTTLYQYNGWQVAEEQSAQGATQATYVYGDYVDDVLNMQRDLIADGTPENYYYLSDGQFNVTGVMDSKGNMLERYVYGTFGEPFFFDGSGTVGLSVTQSVLGNPYLFNGRRYDGDTGLYFYRTRYLNPKLGRFISRDRIGMWGDHMNLGNGYTFAGNTVSTALDPYGEAGHLALAYYAIRIGLAVVGAAATWNWAAEETSFDDVVGETDASIVSKFSFSAGPGGESNIKTACPEGSKRARFYGKRWSNFWGHRELKLYVNWSWKSGKLNGHTDYSASGSSGRAGFKVTSINTHWSEKTLICECIKVIPCLNATFQVRDVFDQPWPRANNDRTTPARFKVCADGSGP